MLPASGRGTTEPCNGPHQGPAGPCPFAVRARRERMTHRLPPRMRSLFPTPRLRFPSPPPLNHPPPTRRRGVHSLDPIVPARFGPLPHPEVQKEQSDEDPFVRIGRRLGSHEYGGSR